MSVSPKNADLVLRLMSAATLRARVIAGNVANQNTPGYQRREVAFEEALSRELDRGSKPGRLAELRPLVRVDPEAQARADGNTVDMEAEVSASRENRLLFELYGAILRGQRRLTEIAVRSDR